MNREYWTKVLNEAEAKLKFKDGYKFVYGPWATLEGAEIAFLSLMPGPAPDNAEMRTISDERGNSYEVEKHATKSPITDQFLRFAEFIGRKPGRILTGVVAPFRFDDWGGMSKEQQAESLKIGEQFWRIPLSQPSLQWIFAIGAEAEKFVVKATDASFERAAPSGWGDRELRCYKSNNKTIICLPHLSRFKLFGRESSEQAIRHFLKNLGWRGFLLMHFAPMRRAIRRFLKILGWQQRGL